MPSDSVYPELKPSGVDWLGDIPAHWNILKVNWLFGHIGSGTTPPSNDTAHYDGEVPWVNTGELDDCVIYETRKTVTEEALSQFSALTMFPRGSLIIALYGATIGKLGILGIDATLNQACCAMSEPNGADIKFMFYWFLGNRAHIIAMGYGGGQPNISQELIKQLRVAVPPLEEQQAITDYLDRKTAQIDAVVREKARQIELLGEHRQALISHAVTRGINLAAPVKPSVILSANAWLDAVPIHWKMERLKFLLNSIEQGWSPQCESRLADEDEWAVLKVGCVNGIAFNSNEHKALPSDLEPRTEYEICTGDILVSRANTRELLASAAIVREVRPKLLLCDKLYRLRIKKDRIDGDFLVRFLRSDWARNQIEPEATGASDSMKNIGQDVISNLLIFVPPTLQEQREIADYLDRETTRIDGIIQTVQSQIERLREYRQAVISAAVTGKISPESAG